MTSATSHSLKYTQILDNSWNEIIIFAEAFWTCGRRTVFYDFNSLGLIIISTSFASFPQIVWSIDPSIPWLATWLNFESSQQCIARSHDLCTNKPFHWTVTFYFYLGMQMSTLVRNKSTISLIILYIRHAFCKECSLVRHQVFGNAA